MSDPLSDYERLIEADLNTQLAAYERDTAIIKNSNELWAAILEALRK
jgi:hypothetical protein